MKRSFAALAAVGLMAFGGVAYGAKASEPRGGDCVQDGAVRTGAIFNNPHTSDDDRIHEHIACLINGAPSGSEIQAATYHFADDSIYQALKKAVDRGVEVRVLVDGKVPGGKHDEYYYEHLRDAIEEAGTPSSWIRPCSGSDEDNACIANRRMHNKLFTLSETHGVPNVTFLTSSNLEDANVGENSGTMMWNSGYTAANDAELHDWFANTYFKDLSAEDAEHQAYFEANDLPKEIGKYRVYHSPRYGGSTVLDILDKVDCHGNSSGGTNPGNRTIVRVSMWSITASGGIGTDIAKRLWDLDNEGCYVDIVAEVIEYDNDRSTDPLRTLLKKPKTFYDGDGKLRSYHGPEVREFHTAKGDGLRGLHEKNLLIDGKYEGKADRKVVFTGSLNFTQSSAGAASRHAVNDETWLQINDAGVHDRFVENFFDVRDAAHTCWQTSKVDACGGDRGVDAPGSELNCHETADEYENSGYLFLYADIYCRGGNDAKDNSDKDEDYGDGAGQIKDFDNRADSIVNTTPSHIKFYNYPKANSGHPEGDTFCVRPGHWVNRFSKYGDGHKSWSNSISSHEKVTDPDKECDRWFGGYHEPESA